MRVDTNDIISVTEANSRGISKLVSEASEGREFVVIKNNRPAAAVVGLDKLERLQRVEEIEDDLKLLTLAVVRSATDNGQRLSLGDVAARLGFDLDALDGDEGEDD